MENASKALIISAEVLLGVILLTLMVFLFRALGSFSDTVDKNIEANNINEFNTKFEIYRNKTDLTAQDVITIANLAKECNNESETIQVNVTILNVEAKYRNGHQIENSYEFIEKYSYDSLIKNTIYFECQSIEYNDTTGKVNKIILKKL